MAGITQARFDLLNQLKSSAHPLSYAEIEGIASPGMIYSAINAKQIKKGKDAITGKPLYSLTKKGQDLLLTPPSEISQAGRKMVKTKPPKAAAKAMAQTVAVVKEEPALMVSPEAHLMLENTQTVLHQNALYRDVLMNALNSMAAQLGMKVVPLTDITIQPSDNNKKD